MAARPTESPATASGPLPARSFRHGSPALRAGARGYTKKPGHLLARKDGDHNVSETWGILQKKCRFFMRQSWLDLGMPCGRGSRAQLMYFSRWLYMDAISHQIWYRQCSLQLVSVHLRLLRLQDFSQQKCCGSGCFSRINWTWRTQLIGC
jgi:hypothetical protein